MQIKFHHNSDKLTIVTATWWRFSFITAVRSDITIAWTIIRTSNQQKKDKSNRVGTQNLEQFKKLYGLLYYTSFSRGAHASMTTSLPIESSLSKSLQFAAKRFRFRRALRNLDLLRTEYTWPFNLRFTMINEEFTPRRSHLKLTAINYC